MTQNSDSTVPATDARPPAPWHDEQRRVRVLIITVDTLGDRMAGPAIRAWEMAKALSRQAEVRLASLAASIGISHPDFDAFVADEDAIRVHGEWADVVIIQGYALKRNDWLAASDKIIVADIYDPMHLESLEQGKDLVWSDRRWLTIDMTDVLNHQIARADFMICASERQRDFWLGQLAAMQRINPPLYDEDDELRNVLDVVPFGVDDAPAVQKQHGLRGRVDGIGPDDRILIWGGGLYNWFDPLTVVRAVAKLAERRPDLRMFFLGAHHPNPDVRKMSVADRTYEEAERLGLLSRSVFFAEEWIPYASRADWLLDADAGISCHFEHLETRFSFRTRILDYLWAGLPIIATDGDSFAEVIRDRELGVVVPAQDADALAAAIETAVYDEVAASRYRANVAHYAEEMRWSQVLAPLLEFCEAPHRAADLLQPRIMTVSESVAQGELEHLRGLVAQNHAEITEVHARLAQAIHDAEIADAARRQVYESRSWRLTRPLRGLARLRRRWTSR